MRFEYAIIKRDVLRFDVQLVNGLTNMSAEGWEPQSFQFHPAQMKDPRDQTVYDGLLMVIMLTRLIPEKPSDTPRGIAMGAGA